ncbi:hypothetical protein [Rudanella lutea]|uniref:hypothetical protein n=1 Tax=Rudanella lutea TaxID=451374 RepID=UPI000382CC9F|nr:hypothetical protein [Rudanella lutea]
MANNKTTQQPGSEPNHQHGYDTTGRRPNMEQVMGNEHKSKQEPEDDHHEAKSKEQLADERGGHGHSGHSGSRNGSRK